MRTILLISTVLITAMGPPPGSWRDPGLPSSPSDTMDGVRKVIQILTDYYEPFDGDLGGFGMHRGSLMTDGPTSRCDGGAGAMCFGDDPDRGPCPADASCHPPPEFLLEGLYETGMKYPSSGYVLGQAVYALAKYGLSTRAMVLVNQCQAQDWWCSMLHGYVLHAQDRFQEAEALFLKGLAGAPIPRVCSWADGTPLLGEWDPVAAQGTLDPGILPEAQIQTEDWPCLDRLDASTLLWWLSDPLYSRAGNERWVEHIARSLMVDFQREMWEARRMPSDSLQWLPIQQALRVRRGTWDSYHRPYQTGYAFWTSEAAAPYHFVPEVALEALAPEMPGYQGDEGSPATAGMVETPPGTGPPLPDARWRLPGTTWDEGFSPPLLPFHTLPAQLARFRRGDSLQLAAAGAVAGSPLNGGAGATAHLILSDRPGEFPLQLESPVSRSRVLFLGQAPPRSYVASLEVLGSQAIGWHRVVVAPLRPDGPEISDLLLYQPSSRFQADSLLAAVALMYGGTGVPQGSRLGLYWEVYGAPHPVTLELELALEEESGGVVQTITGLIPGLQREGRAPVRWQEPATEGSHPGSLVLDLRELDPGSYTVTLKVSWPGQPTLERRRGIQITDTSS